MKTANDFKVAFEAMLVRYSWWSRVAGSQFVDMISTFVGQMVLKSQSASARYLQEAFLSTAVKRASILAAAEDRGYIGRKATPSKGIASITNNSGSTVSIPNNTPVISAASVSYVTVGAVNILAGQTMLVPITQLVLKRFTSTVASAEKFMEVILPKEVSAATHKIDVSVAGVSGGLTLWEKRYMFRRTTAKERVYTEFYRPTEQIGIRFGNGINGMIPSEGSVITLDVWETEGVSTLLDGQKLEITGALASANEYLAIVTETSITGGAPPESAEETRSGALYITPFDNQIAWEDDYAHFIRANLANIVWVNAWGEQEQEIQDGKPTIESINTIFVSAFSDAVEQSVLGADIQQLLIDTSYLNKRYVYRPVNESPFCVTVTGKATGDKDLVHIEQVMRLHLADLFGRTPLAIKQGDILEKDVNQALRDLNLLYDFSLNWTGYPETILLNDYVYLDAENSVFNLEYLEE
ncbi:MAG: hypothetical protein ACRC1W_07645 [Shewanella sp.]